MKLSLVLVLDSNLVFWLSKVLDFKSKLIIQVAFNEQIQVTDTDCLALKELENENLGKLEESFFAKEGWSTIVACKNEQLCLT